MISNEDVAWESFETFYRREYDRAVRLAVLVAGTSCPAEDLVQEVFAGMLGRFADLRKPSAYLAGATVKRVRSWQRREYVRSKVRQPLGRDTDREDNVTDHLLLAAVGRLPYRQRAVLVLRYWYRWSEIEIAEALRCRPGTVKSLASRGLEGLRKEMGE